GGATITDREFLKQECDHPMQTKNLTRRPRSFPQIPLVDISPLRRGTAAEQRRVVDDLGRAAREFGFFYITGTGFDERLLDDLIGVSKRFFALPLEQRMETYIGRSRNHRGYVPPGEEFSASGLTNRQDYFDVGLELPPDDPDYVAGNPLLGPNQWPVLPGFRAAVTRYYQTMFELGRVLMRAFAL